MSCHISGKTCSGSGLEKKVYWGMHPLKFWNAKKGILATIWPGGASPCCFGWLSNFCHCQRPGNRRGTQKHHHRCSSRTSSVTKMTKETPEVCSEPAYKSASISIISINQHQHHSGFWSADVPTASINRFLGTAEAKMITLITFEGRIYLIETFKEILVQESDG